MYTSLQIELSGGGVFPWNSLDPNNGLDTCVTKQPANQTYLSKNKYQQLYPVTVSVMYFSPQLLPKAALWLEERGGMRTGIVNKGASRQ